MISKNKSKKNTIDVTKVNGSYTPIAVLELFTSEGCSSCPPADNLLPQLAKENPAIIPLSFHVDYWNRLGWTDPFSSSDYSDRQRQYSKQFRLESVYTPQLVINGEYEMVGSSRRQAELAIHKVLKEKAAIRISVEDIHVNNDKLSFVAQAEGNIANTSLVAVLVQKKVIINVKAGENKGASLSHTNVVRAFAKKEAVGKTSFILSIPKNLDDWQFVVFAQQKNDLKITGAVLIDQK